MLRPQTGPKLAAVVALTLVAAASLLTGAVAFAALPSVGFQAAGRSLWLRGATAAQEPSRVDEQTCCGAVCFRLLGAAWALTVVGRFATSTPLKPAAPAVRALLLARRAQQPAEGAATAPSATEGSTAAAPAAAEREPLGYWDPREEVGATEPLGYWDPAGFSAKSDKAQFSNYRAAEIKHGRVAMMAAVGAVAQHFIKLPGFEGVPSGIAAVLTPPGSYGLILLLTLAGGLELGLWTESPGREPGNFGDPAGLGMYDTEMREREINNGRIAMFAAVGIIAAELLTGKDAVQQLSF